MAKHLIVMHGRSIKPAEKPMENLVRAALTEGLVRAEEFDIAHEMENERITVSFAYYGDINNAIQSENDKSDRKALSEPDPSHGGALAFPHRLLEEAFELTTQKSPKFTLAAYKKVLQEADDLRLLDDAASVISFFGAIATFGFLNEKIIEFAKPDMAAYLMRKSVGSQIRERLQKYLLPCIQARDDIMLITHSMGCMVAYDVFWKMSHDSEYRHIRDLKHPVQKWLTIGCPLAEPGVRKNLKDGHSHQEDKFPRFMFDDWINFYAKDDYISHRSRMKNQFSTMTSPSRKYAKSIRDKQVYNCWIYNDSSSNDLISNPHDLYGYLMNRAVGQEIAEWAKG